MKPIQTAFKFAAASVFAILAVGCATDLQKKEEMAMSAGFKVITPHTPDQAALLPKLPPKMSLLNYRGKLVYILPDVKQNRAYVGGLKEYEVYQRLREANPLDDERPGDPHVAELNFGGWDGADVVAGKGGTESSKH